MKKLLTFLLAGTTLCAPAQKIARPDAYAKTITTEDLKKHLYIIASPEMEGRETGTEGQRKAAAYIENYFKKIGLQPGNGEGYQMYYNLYQDSLLGVAIEVNGKLFELDKDFTVGNTTIQATLKLSEVTVIGAGAIDSLKNADLAGKLVMVVGTVNQAFNTQLSKKGPVAVLTISSSFPRTSPSNRKGFQSINGFRKTIAPMQFQISETLAKTIAGSKYDVVKMILALLCWRDNIATLFVQQMAARISLCLLAVIATPFALPQIKMPQPASPLSTAFATGCAKSG